MVITKTQKFWLESDFVPELLKQIPAYVFWKDKNSVYLGCNNTFAYSLGLSSAEEVVGKTDYDLPTTEEESDAFRADDRQVIASQKPKLNIEEYQTRSDGERVVLLTNKAPLLDKQNNVIGILGIYYDISDRKKKEAELQEAKAKAKAEHANKAKTEFLSHAVTEITKPIEQLHKILKTKSQKFSKTEAQEFKVIFDSMNQVTGDMKSFAHFDLNQKNQFSDSDNDNIRKLKFSKNSSENLKKFHAFYQKFSFTTRESECVYHMIRGMSARQIGQKISLSPRTIEFYLNNAKFKLDCKTRQKLISRIFENGVI